MHSPFKKRYEDNQFRHEQQAQKLGQSPSGGRTLDLDFHGNYSPRRNQHFFTAEKGSFVFGVLANF